MPPDVVRFWRLVQEARRRRRLDHAAGGTPIVPASVSSHPAAHLVRMELSRISTEKFDDAVKSMTDAGFLKETVEQALKKLIILYEENWEHIEADNYSTLVEALLGHSDPKAGQKKRAEKNLNVDSDHYNKKLKTKGGQTPRSSLHGSAKKELTEEADSLEERTTGNQLQTSRAETTITGENSCTLLESQDPCTSETPTVMCPKVLGSNRHNGIKRQYHDVNDITRGEECVSIPIVCGEDGVLPPPFHYISQNTTFQDACINLSLARIGDENCCSGCFGDCLAEPLPCACARETGGDFAYTRDGLLKEGFLDACVSMLREPLKQPHFYCKGVCPIEQIMKGVSSAKPDACKGHLIKKFIKECWIKCGCTRNCGNRVVQRGITRKLQVFLASRKKGWGLRSAENLPRGAFVCEYVGEILTNTELHKRNTELYGKNNKKAGKARHTYPVNLDADWGTEGVLNDEEALCLDGTFYGNVARFMNHRCIDGNIIAIPVEVETPDHHYYHLAFFTTREVEAFEELTWDYGIDFDDVNHPVKAFKCHCGSTFCRGR